MFPPRTMTLPQPGLLRFFGALKLDEIAPPLLREWWNVEVIRRARSTATGRTYLATLAGLFGYAQDLGMLETNPIGAFREQIRRRSRTKGARAASDPTRDIRPIESPDELQRFVEAAYAEAREDLARDWRSTGQGGRVLRPLDERAGGLRALVAVLAMLDAGLRVGEVAGLTWGQVRWGADESDPTRALVIDRSRPRGGEEGPPKSGRTRVVALSRRLRVALSELYAVQFQPGPLRTRAPRLRASQFHPARVATNSQAGGDRPPLAQGPARHLRQLVALAGGSAWLRVAPARSRRRGRHGAALRALVRRRRLPRADAAPARRATAGSARPRGRATPE
jgi:integrase